MNKIELREITNGFILTGATGREHFFESLDALFKALLSHYEGRDENGVGSAYGKIEITRTKPTK